MASTRTGFQDDTHVRFPVFFEVHPNDVIKFQKDPDEWFKQIMDDIALNVRSYVENQLERKLSSIRSIKIEVEMGNY